MGLILGLGKVHKSHKSALNGGLKHYFLKSALLRGPILGPIIVEIFQLLRAISSDQRAVIRWNVSTYLCHVMIQRAVESVKVVQ